MTLRTLPLAVLAVFSVIPSSAQTAVTVINYSNYAPSGQPATAATAFPVAPGSIATAYGSFPGVPEAGASTSTLNPLPRELGGVRVRINNVDAPLYFAGRNQINFVVPVATPAGRHTVDVVAGSETVGRGSVLVYNWGPALATSNAQTQQVIAQNQDFSTNSAGSRARRGDVVQLYATGCGAIQPVVQDGAPPATLSRATGEVKVFIGSVEAAVAFAGAHPQFPGICQINATVPDRGFISGQMPVFFSVNGIPSNPLTIWIQ
ncbi:MAG TPA: hypothetical protein VES20_02400 [Bryobacteraceae bacterium]|nr:hypothetical protein [Bryobacteraceae bacterium]